VPTGPAGVIVSISGGGSAAATATTTKAGGVGGVVSSLIHGATGSSGAARVPSPAAVVGLGGFVWAGIGAWVVGVASLAVFAVRA
jgi:hypothetical protein